MSETGHNKAIVRRHLEEAISQRKPELWDEMKHGFALYRLADGRLAEAWFQEDDLGYQQQLFG